MKVVRVSIETQKPTHLSKLPELTRKPTDPMPVTIGGRSSPPKRDLGGSDGEFSSPNSMNLIRLTKPLKKDPAYLDPLRSGEDFVVFG